MALPLVVCHAVTALPLLLHVTALPRPTSGLVCHDVTVVTGLHGISQAQYNSNNWWEAIPGACLQPGSTCVLRMCAPDLMLRFVATEHTAWEASLWMDGCLIAQAPPITSPSAWKCSWTTGCDRYFPWLTDCSPTTPPPTLSPTPTSPSSPTSPTISNSPTKTPTRAVATPEPTLRPSPCSHVQVPRSLRIDACDSSRVDGNSLEAVEGDAMTWGPGYIVSPVVDIVNTDPTHTGNFTFTLPVNFNLYEQALTLVAEERCSASVVQCEWVSPFTGRWSSDGCSFVQGECECSHLTVFSVIVRSKTHAEPFCQASWVDYLFVVSYVCIGTGSMYQIVCLRKSVGVHYNQRASRLLMYQHCLLLLGCVLHTVQLTMKPVLPMSVLVLTGLTPTFIYLGLCLHIMSNWIYVSLFPMHPRWWMEMAFGVSATFLVLIEASVVIAIAVAPLEDQVEVAIAGSILMTTLGMLISLGMLASGCVLVRSMHTLNRRGVRDAQCNVRYGSLAMALLLFAQSVVWTAAVKSGGGVRGTAVTAGLDLAFPILDIMCIIVLISMFALGVFTVRQRNERSALEGEQRAFIKAEEEVSSQPVYKTQYESWGSALDTQTEYSALAFGGLDEPWPGRHTDAPSPDESQFTNHGTPPGVGGFIDRTISSVAPESVTSDWPSSARLGSAD